MSPSSPALGALLVLLLVAGCSESKDPARGNPLPEAQAREALEGLLAEDEAQRSAALAAVKEAPDPRFAAPLIELVRANQLGIAPQSGYNARVVALERITGQAFGGDWFAWAEWQADHPQPPPPGFASWKGRLFEALDPRYAEWLSDGQPARIPLAEIDWGGVPVGGIPALDHPRPLPAAEAGFLDPGEPVVGLAWNGEARAYPLRILDWHELVNDQLGGVAFALSYCTLCGSAIVYEAETQGRELRFGSSGLLHRSNKLMFDHETGTLWSQLIGEAVLGPLAAEPARLVARPSVTTRWADWRERHSDTTVLGLETGHERSYAPGHPYGRYFQSPRKLFPTSRARDDLSQKERIFGLVRGGAAKGFSLGELVAEGVRNDRVGSDAVVLLADEGRVAVEAHGPSMGSVRYDAGGAVRAYLRGERRFRRGTDGASLLDENGGTWRIEEEALLGPGGQRAERIAGTLAYWFAWQAFHPETEVVGEPPPPAEYGEEESP